MATCTYTFKNNKKLTGIPALKTYLVMGGLEQLGMTMPKTPNVRFSLANTQEETNPNPLETKTQALRRIAQDKRIRFEVIQQDREIKAAKAGGYQGDDIHDARAYMLVNNIHNPINDETNVHQAESLRAGITSELVKDFEEQVMKPLIHEASDANLTMDEISDYLKMQHVKEANARIRKIKPDEPDATAFGITDEEAQQAMDNYKERSDYAELKKVADKWRNLTDDILNMKVNAGILPQEQADAYRATFSLYVPVKGAEDKSRIKQGTGKGLSVNARDKRRMGHGLRDERIIENIIKDYQTTINVIEKNKVAKIAGNFIKELDDPSIGTVGKPVRRQVFMPGATHYMVTYHGSDVQAFDNLNDARTFINTELMLKAGRKIEDFDIDKTNDDGRVILQPKPLLDDNEFQYYENGKAIRAQWNDELLARAFKDIGVEGTNGLIDSARKFNTFLSKAYTGYSPTFLIKNPIRDAIQGMITNSSKLGTGMALKIFKAYPHAIRELMKHFKHHGSSAEVNAYRKAGGSTGAAYIPDTERIGENIMDAYNEYAGAIDTYNRTYKQAIDEGKTERIAMLKASAKAFKAGFMEIYVLGHFLTFMERANSVTENALRLATYTTLKNEPGFTDAQAALHAKDLMNFNRKGELTTQTGALYLFFNPNAQGTQVMLEALTNSKHKHQAQALAGTIALSAFLMAELMRGGGDDDDEKWKMIPHNLKDRNFIFGFGDTKIMIPVPYGYGIFHSLGNAISDVAHGEKGLAAGIRLAASLLDNFSPFGNPIDSEHGGAYQLLPTIPKMVMAPSVNENAFGAPIMPDKWDTSKPDSQIMWRNTKGSIYSGIAQGLNEQTGGSKYESGMIDVSPETLRYWMNSLTGGAGKFFMDSINLGAIGLQGATPELKEVPIIESFAHEISISDARQAFWRAAEEAKKASDEFAAARRPHDTVAMRDIMEHNKTLIALSKLATRKQKMIKKLRDAQDAVKLSDLSLPQKRAQQKALEIKESHVYTEFLKKFRENKK